MISRLRQIFSSDDSRIDGLERLAPLDTITVLSEPDSNDIRRRSIRTYPDSCSSRLRRSRSLRFLGSSHRSRRTRFKRRLLKDPSEPVWILVHRGVAALELDSDPPKRPPWPAPRPEHPSRRSLGLTVYASLGTLRPSSTLRHPGPVRPSRAPRAQCA